MHRFARVTAMLAAALVAVSLQGCVPLPPAPGPVTGTSSSDPDQPSASGDQLDESETAAAIYLSFACPYNASIDAMNAAYDDGDVDAYNQLARQGRDLTESAVAGFSSQEWTEPLATAVDDFVAALEQLAVPLQAGVDAESVDDLAAIDYTPANELTAPAGVALRQLIGLPEDPFEACGL